MRQECKRVERKPLANSLAFVVKNGLLITFALLLCGCAEYQTKIEDYIEDNAKSSVRSSAIKDDPDYQNYKEFVDSNKLNQDGEYSFEVFKQEKTEGEEPKEILIHEGMIHVTFADNQYLKTEYFLDENLSELIEEKECFLLPGQSIFAPDPEIKNANSNLYQFAGYRIWQYEDGMRKEYLCDLNSNAIFTAPEESEGTEYSIEPIGEYHSRKLGNLIAYYYDSTGQKRSLFGGWSVNGKPITDESAFSATEDYTISFDYDSNEYYFVESTPRANYSDRLGKVTFTTVSATETQPDYSVGLHHYVNVRIDYENKEGIIASIYNWVTRSSADTGIVSIRINGKELEDNSTLPKVKCGDRISVETNPDYKVYCAQAVVSEPDTKTSTLLYTIKVPDVIGNEINIYTSKTEMVKYEKKKIDNASIKVVFSESLNSYEVQDGNYIKSNQNVTVIISPSRGYYISGKNVGEDGKYTETLTYQKYLNKIDSIIKNHPVKKYISVKLSPGDQYGVCTYTLDGQKILGTYNFTDGQKVSMTYTITDSAYEIDHWRLKETISKTIEIKEDMDGTELKRDPYIKVKKK